MVQKIEEIELSKLKLWTENPRDPIDTEASDAEVIQRAINNQSGNWNLDKMLSELGDQYFYNDLPTVVKIKEESYVVYDGNRRVAVLKCLQDPDLYSKATNKLPFFSGSKSLVSQKSLPCNVCDKETALDIVEKYHKSSAKWGKLQYEQFLHFHRGKERGRLMLLNEATSGLVDGNPKLNEEYVQRSLLTEKNLNDIGFSITDGKLVTSLSNDEAIDTLIDIAEVRIRGLSSARKNPGQLKTALIELNPEKYNLIKPYNSEKNSHEVIPSRKTAQNLPATRRVQSTPKKEIIFGGVLRPNGDKSNQIYRAIEDIHKQYEKSPDKKFYLLPIIGFSLRLLLETVAQEYYASLEPSEEKGGKALTCFLGEVAKPFFRDKCSQNLLNQYSLAFQWVNGDVNLEATLAKWAHGVLEADNDTIIRHSKLIGEIIKELWWKD